MLILIRVLQNSDKKNCCFSLNPLYKSIHFNNKKDVHFAGIDVFWSGLGIFLFCKIKTLARNVKNNQIFVAI